MARIVRSGDGTRLDLPGRRATEIAGTATTLRLVEIAPGQETRGPHVHRTFEELIHVLSGAGRIRTDGGTHDIGAGDTVIVPAGERHATENVGNGPLLLLCAFPVPDIRPDTQEFESWSDD